MTEELKEGLKKQLVFAGDCYVTNVLSQCAHINEVIKSALKNGLTVEEVRGVLTPLIEGFEASMDHIDIELDEIFAKYMKDEEDKEEEEAKDEIA